MMTLYNFLVYFFSKIKQRDTITRREGKEGGGNRKTKEVERRKIQKNINIKKEKKRGRKHKKKKKKNSFGFCFLFYFDLHKIQV